MLVAVADRLETACGIRRAGLSQENLERIIELTDYQPRFALELIRVAAAHAQGPLTDDDIDEAARRCRVTDTLRRRRGLAASEADVLDALFSLPRHTYTTGGLEQAYRAHMAAQGRRGVEHTRFWQILNNLARAGLIRKRMSGKGHTGTTQLIEPAVEALA